MIEIPRSLLRLFGAVVRRAWPRRAPKHVSSWLVLHADRDGLTLRIAAPDVTVTYHHAGRFPASTLVLSLKALTDLEGRAGVVTVEAGGPHMRVRWNEGGVPHVRTYDTTDMASLPSVPPAPDTFSINPPGILKALDDAMQTAAREAVRYQTTHVQLRGATGQIVATDGRQMLVQERYRFPWKDNVLVPRTGVFGCRELPQDSDVRIGRTVKYVTTRVGSWTVDLATAEQGRFPDVESAIPRSARTTWHLSPAEAAFLIQSLPRLPGADQESAPITVQLNGQATIRAQGEGQDRPVEIALDRSVITGPAAVFCTPRQHLLRALHLGFTECRISAADAPILCQDQTRWYVWMPLSPSDAIPPNADAIRVTAPIEQLNSSPPPATKPKETLTMPVPKNGAPQPQPQPSETPKPSLNGDVNALAAEAEALQGLLRDGLARASRLVVAIKQQRRQSKLFQSALSSLRQLQQHPA